MQNAIHLAAAVDTGTTELTFGWEFFAFVTCIFIMLACFYIIEFHDGVLLKPLNARNVDDYFYNYQRNPIEMSGLGQRDALFGPPRGSLDGESRALLASEWKPPRRKYAALWQHIWTVRQPLRRLHDYRGPDGRYKFHGLDRPAGWRISFGPRRGAAGARKRRVLGGRSRAARLGHDGWGYGDRDMVLGE
jgi:hypothetical protein